MSDNTQGMTFSLFLSLSLSLPSFWVAGWPGRGGVQPIKVSIKKCGLFSYACSSSNTVSIFGEKKCNFYNWLIEDDKSMKDKLLFLFS
jgi:hypothetical protein